MLAYLKIVNNKRIDYIAIKVARIRLVKEKWTLITYFKYSIRKGADRENSDSIETYLRIRKRKSRAEYFKKK